MCSEIVPIAAQTANIRRIFDTAKYSSIKILLWQLDDLSSHYPEARHRRCVRQRV
jgi:hypothetical protein